MPAHSQKVIVIGVKAERGPGVAMAERFARDEHHVIVAGRRSSVSMPPCAQSETWAGRRSGPTSRSNERANAMNDSDAADIVVFKAARNQPFELRALPVEEVEKAWRAGCFGGFLGGRDMARLPMPLGERCGYPHRRHGKPSRMSSVSLLRRHQGWIAQRGAINGARSAAGVACCACHHRWRHGRTPIRQPLFAASRCGGNKRVARIDAIVET